MTTLVPTATTPPEPADPVRSRRIPRLSPPLVAMFLAIALFFGGGLINPHFVNPQQAIEVTKLAALLGIIAAGQTLVIISGREGIDLSIGAVVTLSAILIVRISNGQNALILPGLAVGLTAGALVGLINGLGVTFLNVPPLVMTLGMTGVVEGTIRLVTHGQVEGSMPPLVGTLIATPLVFGIPGVVFGWIIFGGLMWLLLERTTYGKQLVRHWREPYHGEAVRLAGDAHGDYHVCAEWDAGGLWRIHAFGQHAKRVPEPGQRLPVSVDSGGGRWRNCSGRRAGQLFWHDVRCARPDLDRQPVNRARLAGSLQVDRARLDADRAAVGIWSAALRSWVIAKTANLWNGECSLQT